MLEFFYLLHLVDTSSVLYWLPLRISSTSSDSAKLLGDAIVKHLEPTLSTLFPPSDPVLIHAGINAQRLENAFQALNATAPVEFHFLPQSVQLLNGVSQSHCATPASKLKLLVLGNPNHADVTNPRYV